jgi:uncharacterized OsmC-like protein
MNQSQTVQHERATNGVAVDKLVATVELVKQNPAMAQFRFRAKNRWENGSLNRSEIKEFYGAGQEDATRIEAFVLTNDEAPVLLGADRGPNPVEYLLNALAGCMTTTMVYHAALQGIDIEGIESELEGELDLRGFLQLEPTIRQGFSNVKVKFKVKSSAQAELLKELAQRSPVYDMIVNPVAVELTVENS